MQETRKVESNITFAFDSLEALRKKLLDLTGRNSLLSYQHPQASCIRIIDELPNQIVEVLKSGESLAFLDVPEPTEQELIDNGYLSIDTVIDSDTKEKITTKTKIKEPPTAKQWAKHLGFDVVYDLPEQQVSAEGKDHHQDNNLQSVFYASGLDARLRKMRSTADTAIEESGASVLFLGIGFLEWFDNDHSEMKRFAPLYTLPVKLDRSKKMSKQGKFQYTISLKDDGLISNITLKEKLANDFNLALPLVEDDLSPEDYFQQVEEAILTHKPHWKIRRQATLLMLNFTKQAMYQDLDPENWPDHAKIQDHPLIAQFFGSGEGGHPDNTLHSVEEHPIDDIPDIHNEFPLIFDADSSQHSALIDALNGENLVIEGPPGSGKSQTITNLIAAAIANGKKVLFVAEKMAALNVVKDRLDKAGLGSFCLELHSHKTNKQAILSALGTRMNESRTFRKPADINVDIMRFEDLKTKLRTYVDFINADWAETGLSIHEILNKATRYREQLKINPDVLKIMGVKGESFTPLKQRELFDQADGLKSIYDQVSQQALDGSIANHYWYGVTNTDLMSYQLDDLKKPLQQWTHHLEILNTQFQKTNNQLQLGIEDVSLDEINKMISHIQSLPELKGGEIYSKFEYLVDNIEGVDLWLTQYSDIHHHHKTIAPMVYQQTVLETSSIEKLDKVTHEFNKLGIHPHKTLEDVALLKSSIDETQSLLEKVNVEFNYITPNIPSDLSYCFTSTQQGLTEYKILIRLIDALPKDLWRYRNELYDSPDLDPLLEKMTRKLGVLTPLHKNLHDHIHLHRLPDTDTLREYESILSHAGLFKWFSSTWRETRHIVLSLSSTLKPDTKHLLSLVPELVQYSEGIDDMDSLNKQDDALQDLYKGVETPISQVSKLRDWYKKVRKEYGLGFGERVGMGNALLALDRSIVMSIQDSSRQQLSQRVDQVVQKTHRYRDQCNGFVALQDKESPLDQSLESLSTAINEPLVSIEQVIKENTFSLDKVSNIRDRLVDQQKRVAEWLGSSITHGLSDVLPLSILPNEMSKPHFDAGVNSLVISKVLAKNSALLRSLVSHPSKKHYQELVSTFTEINQYLQSCTDEQQIFVAAGQVDINEWMESSEGCIDALIIKNTKALSETGWLFTWLDYVRLRNKLSTKGLKNIIHGLESNSIATEQLQDVVQLCTYHQLAEEVFAEHPTIASFSGMEQMAHRKKFQEYDKKLMKLQQQLVAYKASRVKVPVGVSSGRVRDYTEVGLIKHNLGLKRPRVAVRSLLNGAGTSIQALKPCFMMSPMSVAQYLKPSQFNFDLVVMDEASQIRPEDALGSIARGNSLVVVGDPKQLPPTSFFQKILNNNHEDMVGLEESESILDAVLPLFKQRRLRWHYRSRHESLIAFSNYHFYKNNLILFPSPLRNSEQFGIRYNQVTDGYFIKGRNTEEAKAIVDDLVKQLINHPKESVGIVAMNSVQRDEIDLQIQAELKDNVLFQKAYQQNQGQEEVLFIKNLENVQGDERDVIIISMTYGPEIAGAMAMHQRFGPINSDVGWRRLNVLFTRSKMRMHIFSSMTSGHIKTSENSSRGVVSLKAFLSYAETGIVQHYEHTGKPVDSDFEIAVMDALAERGYECEPQLGVTGYFLDIAVKDPDMSGRFLMGIECDGASYHSAKSTRDRDRLRQEVLENLGWTIRRIWSTDWFKNPQAQLEPIFQELARMRSVKPVEKQVR
ncbi:MAG: DUF4011 domain-containing protein [Thiotrichaceae bacterium]|nr:DUF4011 domain-containing protein [Thiotrichaceae bacterium]